MKIPAFLQSGSHATTITVIGCGGTGSVLLQQLARINTCLLALGKKGIIVTCVDDDVVTPANQGRQLFTKQDIGRPKCIVMIERINRFYGTNWIAIPKKFTMNLSTLEVFPGNIVISCVDNMKARRVIANYIGNCSVAKVHDYITNYFWIDTGNRKDYGQVILSTENPKLPNVFDMFPNAERDESTDNTPSCSLAEALDKQSLFINTLVAQMTAELVWDILQKPVLEYRGAFINLNKPTPIRRIKTWSKKQEPMLEESAQEM